MDNVVFKVLGAVAAFGLACCGALGAERTFHTFIVSEVYSSVDGTVQFVELKENAGLTFQNAFAGHTLTATNADGTQEHVFMFLTNLPSTATANKRVLIATANFASLPGGVTPDYIIPPNFLFATGGVNFAGLIGGADVTYAALPTNGQQSLVFPGGSLAVNSPTNFAGQAGTVNVPAGSCCVSGSCAVTTAGGCAGTFAAGGSCTPNPCPPPATGACCVGAACTVQTSAGCAGTFQGAGSACGTTENPTTCCPANFNHVGGVTVQDIFDFLAAYFNNDNVADFNGVGGVTVQDIFDYLAAYFAGCAS
jgi:hypothetical protein